MPICFNIDDQSVSLNGDMWSFAGMEHGLPLPYRSQAAPVLPSTEELEALPEGETSTNIETGCYRLLLTCCVMCQHGAFSDRDAAWDAGVCRDIAVRNCMTKSITSVEPDAGHASLGLRSYVQFTSPIRRYTDMLAHYQV